jgi:hypothetical protein
MQLNRITRDWEEEREGRTERNSVRGTKNTEQRSHSWTFFSTVEKLLGKTIQDTLQND